MTTTMSSNIQGNHAFSIVSPFTIHTTLETKLIIAINGLECTHKWISVASCNEASPNMGSMCNVVAAMETTFTIRPCVVDVMSWRMTNQIIFISDVVSVLLSVPWLFDRRPLVTYTLPQYKINLCRDKNWSENEIRSRVEIDLNLINHNEDVWVAINSRAFNFHLEVVHVERDAINTETQWNITWTWWWCWLEIGRGNLSLIWLNDDGAEMKDALLVKRFVNYLLFGVNMNEGTRTRIAHRTMP